jgi:hypothetical protein
MPKLPVLKPTEVVRALKSILRQAKISIEELEFNR